MAAAWDIDDDTLKTILEQWRAYLLDSPSWVLHLYQNDYTPIPGSTLEDYEEADFAGYEAGDLINTTWGSVTVGDHIASMTNSTAVEFIASDTGFVSQTIYGYYITDEDDNYRWGERFATAKTMEPDGTLTVVPKFRHKTAPA